MPTILIHCDNCGKSASLQHIQHFTYEPEPFEKYHGTVQHELVIERDCYCVTTDEKMKPILDDWNALPWGNKK